MFDFDGSLVDSVDWLAGALATVSGYYGLEPFDPDTLHELHGMDTRTVMARSTGAAPCTDIHALRAALLGH